MTLVKFLVREFPRPLAFAILVSLIGGLSTVGLLLVVVQTLKTHDLAVVRWEVQLAVLGLAFVASRVGATLIVALIDAKAAGQIRTQLVDGILSTPLRHLEMIGATRLVTGLTAEVFTVSAALPRLALLCTNVTIVAGYLGYLSWLSATATLAIGSLLVVGAPLHWIITRHASKYFWMASYASDKLSKDLEAVALAIKQLKLNRELGDCVRNELAHNQTELRQRRFQALTVSTLGGACGQLAFLAAIGILLAFARSSEQALAQGMTEFVFVFLYMVGPLEAALGALSAFANANVAFARLQELGFRLNKCTKVRRSELNNKRIVAERQTLEFRGVTYRYRGESPFNVGPLNLLLLPGEIVFIAGANGSGKTTFAKLLTGLYAPDEGEILVGKRPVDGVSRDWYRQHFSAVFADAYLFRRLTTLKDSDVALQVKNHLKTLGLDETVAVQDGILSTTTDLSHGQKKRLALLAVYLEDRPIYVFDEWAADQDPGSREFFYKKFLPELRSKGRLVIAITHDEQYYSVADRVLRFADGNLVNPPSLATVVV